MLRVISHTARRIVRFRLLPVALLLIVCSRPVFSLADSDALFPVVILDEIVLTAPTERAVPVKVFMPDADGSYPLIVLSHGTFSNRHRYDLIAEHWAGQGYVVMLPQHIDADYGVTPSSYDVMQDVVRQRVADMSLVLDELEAMQEQVPELQARIAPGQFVAAGHSIGTQVAMLVTGGRFKTGFDNEEMRSDESRYRALVLISDPGKMRLMPLNMWLASSVPTFMATGTDDFGIMGSRDAPTEAQTELLSLGLAPEALRVELLLDKGDHYFGGLVQKPVKAEPDHEGLAIFNRLSTLFLDAVMKDDSAARQTLETIDLMGETAGRADLIIPGD